MMCSQLQGTELDPFALEQMRGDLCFCGKATVEDHEFCFCSTQCAREDALRALDDTECHYRDVVRRACIKAGVDPCPRRRMSAEEIRLLPDAERASANAPLRLVRPTKPVHRKNKPTAGGDREDKKRGGFPTLSEVTGVVLSKKAMAGEELVVEAHERPRWQGFGKELSRVNPAPLPADEPFKQISLDAIPLPEDVPRQTLRHAPQSTTGLKNNIRKSVAALFNSAKALKTGKSAEPEMVFGHPVNPFATVTFGPRAPPPPSCVPVPKSKGLRRSASFAGWDAFPQDPGSDLSVERSISMPGLFPSHHNMHQDDSTARSSTIASRREVFCDCDTCKLEDQEGKGQLISAALRESHRLTQSLNHSALTQRGRGHQRAASTRSRATPPTTTTLLSRGRGAINLNVSTRASRSISTHTPSRVLPSRSTSQRPLETPQNIRPLVGGEAPAQSQYALFNDPPHRDSYPDVDMEFIQGDFATSPSPSYTQRSPPASPAQPQSTPGTSFREPAAPHPVDPPGEQLRVLPPLQYQPVIATRTVPVPMHGGHMVPLAQSRPALIPICLTPPSIPQPAELRAPRQRKRAAGRRKDILEGEDDFVAARVQLQDSETPASETQPSLGLYDDPEALDELHQDPLVHTVPTSQSDDNSESDNSSDTSLPIPHDTPRNRPLLPEVVIPTQRTQQPRLAHRTIYDNSHPRCRLFKPLSDHLFRRLTGKQPKRPPPVCAAPIQLPSSLLADFLAREGNEVACESWKRQRTPAGETRDISDGDIWKMMKGPDNELFFNQAHEPEELHIGVTMSLDWFGRKTSVYGPSHSSGVLSLCISNLPRALRYRAENLLIPFMTPGPTEPTGPQLQNYLKVVVDDLLELYTHGVRYHTPLYPQGRLVRVVLLGVVCDHPAMYQDEIFSDASLRNEFPGRKGEDHRKCCYEEKDLPEAQRATFFKEHGARWTELARLPYFDLVRQTIIDPMHNLLLGIVKTQWYSQWIQTPALRASTDKRARELDVIHRFLASLYGISAMKPNFHWAVHLTRQIQDFGPVYNFWAFLSERLNKVLKSSNSNNWTGGQVEISMMREFCRGAQMDAIAQSVLLSPDNNVVKVMMQRMLNEGDEALGTVQDAATELDDLNAYLHIQAGPIVGIKSLSDHARAALHAIYNSSGIKVHYRLETPSSVLSRRLNDDAQFYRHVLLDGRRITPLSENRRDSAGSSIVRVIWNEDEWYGEVINILSHTQDHIGSDPKILAEIRYMKELQLSPVPDDPWSDLCFSVNEYWEPTEGGSPPRLVPVDLIECQIARGVIDSTVPQLWITTTMDRVSLVLHPKITS
ncbi:hypothetical protein PAXINDRAFT_181417 [Paxillus involutus ATCC 200175]|uniref:Uncharacterized protein n=1 Tax=Paxillus involutus ATCC 200175 TaxID=664439 RepID=A0A0C9SV34_PAXIN|nr:hypothetical protein PAXINDRAFT_181417 [Paxillus involutus ATCC 200175]